VDDPETGDEYCFRHATMFPNTENMFYLNADNDSALQLFEPLFEAPLVSTTLCDAAGGAPIKMQSAQLIVVDQPTVRVSKWHQDYRSAPRHTMFSGICAVSTLPAGAGGLEHKPWNTDGSDGAATALKYEDGQLVLFDGGLTHRTEPYEHANGMRILAVLDCYSETDQEAVRMVGQERGNGFCRMLNLNNNACPGK